MKKLSRKVSLSQRLSEVPVGTFLQTEKGYFYVVSLNKRYFFIHKRVLDSWSPLRTAWASEEDPAVRRLKIVSKMKFRNGSLLYSQANGKMYLVSDNKLRQIINPDWLVFLNLKRLDAVWVSEDEINLHDIGEVLK